MWLFPRPRMRSGEMGTFPRGRGLRSGEAETSSKAEGEAEAWNRARRSSLLCPRLNSGEAMTYCC